MFAPGISSVGYPCDAGLTSAARAIEEALS